MPGADDYSQYNDLASKMPDKLKMFADSAREYLPAPANAASTLSINDRRDHVVLP